MNTKQQLALWYDYHCPLCVRVWESDNPVPDREWCSCGTEIEPELIGSHD